MLCLSFIANARQSVGVSFAIRLVARGIAVVVRQPLARSRDEAERVKEQEELERNALVSDFVE